MTFIKGQKAWNEGLPQSKGAKEKNRLAHLHKYEGEDNPMYGKTHTLEARYKIIDANLGRTASEETKLKMSEAHKKLNPSDWGAGFKKGAAPWNKLDWATDRAYYAGLVDGEGSISIDSGSKANSIVYRTVKIRIQMVKSLEVLLEGQKIWGGFIYYRKRNQINPNWADSEEWVIQNSMVDKFLKDIFPYLRLKRRQAEIALEYRKLQTRKKTIKVGGTGLTNISEKELEYRKELEAELKSLHLNKGTHVE